VTLLFDQNISYKITKSLSGTFGDCIHVSSVKLTNSSDDDIWKYAKANGFCIVTFDADFLNLATLRGIPPKVILLKTGNRKTSQLVELLKNNRELIDQFLHDTSYQNIGCLEIVK
jgi:predicted nuclease of predicted toxin-antitoxin system